MAPTVSINLCCYNSEIYLRETLDSIVGQTFKDWELIVVNDGSSDSTEHIIRDYQAKGFPIVYYYQENKGLSKSRNKALELSKGKYVAFIDHDDLWLPEKLSKLVEYFGENREDVLCYSDGYKMYGTSKTNKRFSLDEDFHTGKVFPYLIIRDFINLQTVVINRSVAGDELYFVEELKTAEEYELFLRLALRWSFGCIPEPLAYYRIHETNLSKDHTLLLKDHYYIIDEFRDVITAQNLNINRHYSSLYRSVVINLLRQGKRDDAGKFLKYLVKYPDLKNIMITLLVIFHIDFVLQSNNLDKIRNFKALLSGHDI